MTKRKILLLAMSLCMVAILAVGGTLAYFTAEDGADNVFTMGYVDAEIEEEFDPESELTPGATIQKEVLVKNTGNTGLYARVHIAVRSELDDGNPAYLPVNNFLHLNYFTENFGDEGWSFADTITGAHIPTVPSDVWNFYTQEIDGESYNVYVVTYTSVVEGGESTPPCLKSVQLDKAVTATPVYNEDGTLKEVVYADSLVGNDDFVLEAADYSKDDNLARLHIKVWAEAVQSNADGFTDAYAALNTAFGTPGDYNPWTTEQEAQ